MFDLRKLSKDLSKDHVLDLRKGHCIMCERADIQKTSFRQTEGPSLIVSLIGTAPTGATAVSSICSLPYCRLQSFTTLIYDM